MWTLHAHTDPQPSQSRHSQWMSTPTCGKLQLCQQHLTGCNGACLVKTCSKSRNASTGSVSLHISTCQRCGLLGNMLNRALMACALVAQAQGGLQRERRKRQRPLLRKHLLQRKGMVLERACRLHAAFAGVLLNFCKSGSECATTAGMQHGPHPANM